MPGDESVNSVMRALAARTPRVAPRVKSPNLVTIRPIQNSFVPELNGPTRVDSIERCLPEGQVRYALSASGANGADRYVKIYTGLCVCASYIAQRFVFAVWSAYTIDFAAGYLQSGSRLIPLCNGGQVPSASEAERTMKQGGLRSMTYRLGSPAS